MTTATLQITEPGVYDIPHDVYLADPVPDGSLSCSGAKLLLPPNCPALFAWRRENPQEHKDEFDFGHAAHKMVLGTGPELAVIDAKDWKTKAAQDQRDAARLEGKVPLLRADYERVVAMAAVVAAHPIASALFNPNNGKPEASLFWYDDRHPVTRRGRLDWLPETDGGRLIIPDYKTARSAQPGEFAKSAANYGYHQQDAWYRDAVQALGIAEDVGFVFVVQEKTAPYLVTVVELDITAAQIGQHLNRQAIDVYAECTSTGRWPGYSDDVELISLPAWYERNHEESQ
jgi:hypothetical protein